MVFRQGDEFNETFTVSAGVHDQFMALFGDTNPLHTDDAFARAHRFDAKVMHGNILNGFVSYFIGMCLPTKEVVIHSQEINYKHAVYMNDTLQFNAIVADVHEAVRAVAFAFQFKNANGKTVAKGKFQIGLIG